MEHISNEHFQKLNWLPINQRFKQCVISAVFKFAQNNCPAYMNEVFRPAENIRKTSTRQNGMSYIGPAIWNRILEVLKKNPKFEYFQT